ncbi:MAG: hypothetical protein KKA99_02390 [Gammaproteobacteria bacterium]|nr:hypothetical protein [Gammaproteobacteria bacterium]MBU1628568.1 hypothetical protein [Gammaproteobacteria bacterium]
MFGNDDEIFYRARTAFLEERSESSSLGDNPVWQGVSHGVDIATEVLDKSVLSPLDPLSGGVSRTLLSVPGTLMDGVEHYVDAKNRGAEDPFLDAVGMWGIERIVTAPLSAGAQAGIKGLKLAGEAVEIFSDRLRESAAEFEDFGRSDLANIRESMYEKADSLASTGQILQYPQKGLDAVTETLFEAGKSTLSALGNAMGEAELVKMQVEEIDAAADLAAFKEIGRGVANGVDAVREGICSLGDRFDHQGEQMQQEGKDAITEKSGFLATALGGELRGDDLERSMFGNLLKGVGTEPSLTQEPQSFLETTSTYTNKDETSKVPSVFESPSSLFSPSSEESGLTVKHVSESDTVSKVAGVTAGVVGAGIGVKFGGGASVLAGLSAAGPTVSVTAPLSVALPVVAGVAAGVGLVAGGGYFYDKTKHGYHHVKPISDPVLAKKVTSLERELGTSLTNEGVSKANSIFSRLDALEQEKRNDENREIRNGRWYRFGSGHKGRAARLRKETLEQERDALGELNAFKNEFRFGK